MSLEAFELQLPDVTALFSEDGHSGLDEKYTVTLFEHLNSTRLQEAVVCFVQTTMGQNFDLLIRRSFGQIHIHPKV